MISPHGRTVLTNMRWKPLEIFMFLRGLTTLAYCYEDENVGKSLSITDVISNPNAERTHLKEIWTSSNSLSSLQWAP
jgi:hypothetical protein